MQPCLWAKWRPGLLHDGHMGWGVGPRHPPPPLTHTLLQISQAANPADWSRAAASPLLHLPLLDRFAARREPIGARLIGQLAALAHLTGSPHPPVRYMAGPRIMRTRWCGCPPTPQIPVCVPCKTASDVAETCVYIYEQQKARNRSHAPGLS